MSYCDVWVEKENSHIVQKSLSQRFLTITCQWSSSAMQLEKVQLLLIVDHVEDATEQFWKGNWKQTFLQKDVNRGLNTLLSLDLQLFWGN